MEQLTYTKKVHKLNSDDWFRRLCLTNKVLIEVVQFVWLLEIKALPSNVVVTRDKDPLTEK